MAQKDSSWSHLQPGLCPRLESQGKCGRIENTFLAQTQKKKTKKPDLTANVRCLMVVTTNVPEVVIRLCVEIAADLGH